MGDRSVRSCLIAGGETAVTVRGAGKGGRSQELALAAAMSIEHLPIGLLSFGTDGIDGPTDAAGAWVETAAPWPTPGHWALMRRLRSARNDAYPFFAALDDLVITGPTGTTCQRRGDYPHWRDRTLRGRRSVRGPPSSWATINGLTTDSM